MLGFHTKDEGSIIYLISNLFKIMGQREQTYMNPKALKICQKLIFRMLKFHKKSEVIFVLEEIFKNDRSITDDDVALSVLINNYVKPLMQDYSDPSDENDPFLLLIVEKVFPSTLDVMSDNVPHLNMMTQRIQSSLSLYVLMRTKFKANKCFQEWEAIMNKTYFENMLKAIKTSEDLNKADEKKAEKNLDEDQKFLEMQQVQILNHNLMLI
jgi:hypothetical protein